MVARFCTCGSTELSAANIQVWARARCAGSRGQQRRASLADVQHDGAGFKQGQVALLVSRNLAKGLQGAIRRAVLLIAHGDEILLVGQTGFLQAPSARAGRVTRPCASGGTQLNAVSRIRALT